MENDVEMFQVVKHGIAMEDTTKSRQYAYDFTEDVKMKAKGLKKHRLIRLDIESCVDFDIIDFCFDK